MQAVQRLDSSFILMVFSIADTGSNLFLHCYYGISTTIYYSLFADCLYKSNWMALPVDLQKPFILMIANAQQKLSYHGYRMVDLNLETFTKVSIQLNSENEFDLIDFHFIGCQGCCQLLLNVQDIDYEGLIFNFIFRPQYSIVISHSG